MLNTLPNSEAALPAPRLGFSDYLYSIENRMDSNDLLNHLYALVDNLTKERSNVGTLGHSQSSQPTGTAWTWGAFVASLKNILHLNSTNLSALKDILTLPINEQLTLTKAVIERLLSTKYPQNDRNNTFESVMNILGKLGPKYHNLISVVTQPLITTFYNDIPKPYINYVGHQFRTADGSENSLVYPNVGRAGSNYVRSVTSTAYNNEDLPSAKEVFHKLLKRPDGTFEKHKGGINMMLLYLAILITHDLFYSDPQNPQRNMTTSYLDLSHLYGNSREQQLSVRQMKGGLLKPDQWYDKRLVIQPAGVASLLVVFSRNHNHIARKLLENNENNRFSYGPGFTLATEEEQDEKLFQTARLVNNGCYANVIIHDYIRTIVGTNASSDFVLDPFATPSNPIYGNAVSIEFNIIYRWHAAIGKEDSEWIDKVMSILGPSLENNTVKHCPVPTIPSLEKNEKGGKSKLDYLMEGFNHHFVHASEEELEKGNPIAGAHRDVKTGYFPDVDIIKALKAGYFQSAHEIGNGQSTPSSLEHVEIAGINQSRALGCCYFNEFRKFANLTTMKTFEDFSEKPAVQKALKELYGTPDRVELYVGLMVERTKQTGLRLPYTMGRAILSDAVNLLRNDRILTNELTPNNLTNWGYRYTLGDPKSNNRVFPGLIRDLFPEAQGTSVEFTQEELKAMFNVPQKS
ncbi:heme peroxidase [Sporodiniella umbellata]|nr:heme peroxidase [Sporodiniella umbellata]